MNKKDIRVIFMGTPEFSVPVLKMLVEETYNVVAVITQPDRPVGRKKVMTPPPVKVAAEQLNIPVYQPNKISLPEEIQLVQDLKPDLIITAAFGQLLPEAILNIPRFKCVNVHASLLPKLRGGAPIHYAIINGDQEAGVTLMYMVKKLDAGDMLAKVSLPIEENDTVGSLHDKLSQAGTKLLKDTLPELLAGRIEAIAQDDHLATFAPNIKRADEWIDWHKPGEVIYNQVRGMNPWPVAYTTLAGQNVKIWETIKVQLSTKHGVTPGTIIEVKKDGIVVATGNDTAIIITALQLAGKKRVTAQQFLTNKIDYVGQQLGVIDEK